MIASSAYAGARTKRRLWWLAALLAVGLLLAPMWANAASLRVCVVDDASPDVTTAPVFMNGNPFHPDLLAGSTVASGKRCNLLPIPATLAKGQNFTTTVKYANSVGTVSAPSNGLPFRNPGDPPVPVLDSVSIVAP